MTEPGSQSPRGSQSTRGNQSFKTRILLLTTAEKLFATQGIAAVSNRQICEAAGQGNNYAVGYHFGSRDGLLTALLRFRNDPIEVLRQDLVSNVDESTATVQDWIRCLVEPQLQYIGTSPGPTHYGAFCTQMAADPATTDLLYEQAAQSPLLTQIIDAVYRSIPTLPDDAVAVRSLMSRNVLISAFADFEHTRNATDPPDTNSWRPFANAVIDGLVGLWSAPAS